MKLMGKFIFVVGLMLIAFSCSKEKKLEKTLYKKDGSWKVTSAEWQQVSQSSTSGQSITTGTSTDAGTFNFEEDGSGSYSLTFGTKTYNQTFNWTVTDEEFSIVKVAQSIDIATLDIVQLAVAFSGTQLDKNTLQLEGSETLQYFSGDLEQSVMTASITLVRQ